MDILKITETQYHIDMIEWYSKARDPRERPPFHKVAQRSKAFMAIFEGIMEWVASGMMRSERPKSPAMPLADQILIMDRADVITAQDEREDIAERVKDLLFRTNPEFRREVFNVGSSLDGDELNERICEELGNMLEEHCHNKMEDMAEEIANMQSIASANADGEYNESISAMEAVRMAR